MSVAFEQKSSLEIPIIAGVDELEQLDKQVGHHLIRVNCRDLPDYGETAEDVLQYAEYFAKKAREYDNAIKKTSQQDVVIHCAAGLHRSVSVAIAWCVWRGVCKTPEECQRKVQEFRGPAANPLKLYNSSIRLAIDILKKR